MSEIALQFIFESLCYFARTNETSARQMTLTYIDRELLTDEQITTIRNILAANNPSSEQE